MIAPWGLKPVAVQADRWSMGRHDLACPICNADLPMDGDERRGDEVFCTVCGAPIVLKAKSEDAELEAEPDF